ncbi:unnamed protein product [Danaus chrysippus]|uniref:(African queen) hypothetical protein n=1 Tax=Danaus chrysippus TaxID=151541 RepID=A0A8J2Q5B2_9NEOP|nr:unnamed protein product [Danaus chrysippus]
MKTGRQALYHKGKQKIMKMCEQEGLMHTRVANERDRGSTLRELEGEPVLHVCRQTLPFPLPSPADPRLRGPCIVGFPRSVAIIIIPTYSPY